MVAAGGAGPRLTLEMVQAARERIAPYVRRTRTEANATLSERLGVATRVKLELFQKTGSFKPRGTFNQILERLDEARTSGVVAVSGGNFAQAVAYAGKVLGVRARVLMAEGTPRNYIEATRGYGAEVELTPDIAEAFARAERYRQDGLVYLHPYAHPLMMAGNGTIGLELLEEAPDLTDLIISIGGGGLISGITTAVKGLAPQVRIWGVETEGADVMARSLAAGRPLQIQPTSLARTLGAPDTSQLALEIVRDHVEAVEVVSDAEAYHGVRLLLERAKVLTELAAGCTVAAAEQLRAAGRIPEHGKLVLLLCGGNVSLDDLCDYRTRFESGQEPG